MECEGKITTGMEGGEHTSSEMSAALGVCLHKHSQLQVTLSSRPAWLQSEPQNSQGYTENPPTGAPQHPLSNKEEKWLTLATCEK